MAPNVQIEPIGRVRCQTSLWRSAGVLRLTAIVKATFALVDQDVARPIEPVAIGLRDRHYDNNPRRSTYESFELAPYLPGVGVTLVGVAHPPEGHVTPSMSVRLGVYDEETPVLEKTLHVFGERAIDDPQVSRPLGPMPLVYERAVGGRANLAGSALYNLVSPDDPSKPACFAPVPLAWRALGGRGLDPATMKASPVEIPDGFDFSFFNPAPPDQRVSSLRGDEWIVLDGMSARAPRLQTRLPGAKARALFRSLTGKTWEAPTELSLPLDTVVIDAEDETLSLLFRGHIRIDERSRALHVLAGVELPGASLEWPKAAGAPPPRLGSGEHPRFGAPPAPPAAPIAVSSAGSSAISAAGSSAGSSGARPASELPPTEMARPKGVPGAAAPLPSSAAPASTLEDDGGLFGTVVGTLDEILASMPALPFEGAGAPSRRDPSSIDPVALTIPATPWDRPPNAAAPPKVTMPPLDVDETMDPTAVRRALAASFEDMGTVVGGDEVIASQALPFQPTGDVEPARPPPLGLPKALPFEERAYEPRAPASRAAVEPPRVVTTSAPTLLSAPPLVSAPASPSTPALVGAPPLVVAPTLASPALGARSDDPTPAPRPTRSRATTLNDAQLRAARGGPGDDDATPAAPVAAIPLLDPPLADAPRTAAPPTLAPELSADPTDGDTSPGSSRTPPPLERAGELTHSSERPAPSLAGAPTVRADAESGPDPEQAPTPPSVIAPPDAAAKLRRDVQARLAADESLADLSLVGVNLSGLDLSRRNLSGLDLSGANLTRAVLKGARLSRAKLEGATLSFASLEEADLEEADLRKAVLEGAKLSGAKLTSADLTLASAQKASFEGARGRHVRFVEAKLESADFSRADLVEPDFSMAQAGRSRFEGARLVDGVFHDLMAEASNFDRADLSRAKLDRAILRRCYLLGTTTTDATLEHADLSGARAARCVLDRATLEHATLDGADLTGASLLKAVAKGVSAVGARLDGAKLDEADLRLAKLADAKLTGASLQNVQAGRADLSKADLSKADLSGGSFRGAKLTEAKLAAAAIERADFRDAHLARADLSGCDRESARFAGANLEGVLE